MMLRRAFVLVFPGLLLAGLLLSTPAARAANHMVQASGINFSPSSLTIQVGDSVTWTNGGGFHDVRADNGSFRCANGCDGSGGNGDPSSASWSFTLTFNTAGTIRYFCEQHGGSGGIGMSGQIIVQEAAGVPGSVAWNGATATVNEGAGNLTLTLARTGGDDGAISVHYATANGTATAGSDYTAASGTVSWGDNDDTPKTVVIPIANDSAVEGNESFTVALSAPTGGAAVGSPGVKTVTIIDNDSTGPAGTLQLAAATYTASEADGVVTVTVTRTGGTSSAVGVSYTTSDGTATAGSDYTPVSGTLSWANGDTTAQEIDVQLDDDAVAEGDETLTLTLSSPTGGATLGNPSTATLAIGDDDTGPTAPCVADATTLCFFANRFQAAMTWRFANGQSGSGQAAALSDQAGTFSFVNPANREVLLKMVNGCSLTGSYWVFFAATTNVEFAIQVQDSQTGTIRTYTNALGTAAPPVQDTAAFATCP